MGSGTTTVQGWPFPENSDAPQVANDIAALATALDVVAKRLSGVASARPTASTTPVDTIYYATDTFLYSICTGAVWETMLVAGPWIALSLSGGVSAVTAVVPSARVEGDTIKFKGGLTGGSNASTWATLPTGIAAPSSTLYEPVTDPNRTSGTCATYALEITSGGALVVQGSSSGSEISLDGRNYSLT
jgi:hypothetical protein